MVVLALPFAYLHFAQAALQAMFSGGAAGISFFLLNNVFGRRQPANWSPGLPLPRQGLISCVVTGARWPAAARRSPFWRANL